MSKESLEQVIDRVWHDGEYWTKLQEWPVEVQDEFSLSEDEIDALRAADINRLRELGVNEGHLEIVASQFVPKQEILPETEQYLSE